LRYNPQGNKNAEEDFYVHTVYNGEELQNKDMDYRSDMSFKDFKSAVRKHLLITSVTNPRKFKDMADYCGLDQEEDNSIKYLSMVMLLLLVIIAVLMLTINYFNKEYRKVRDDLDLSLSGGGYEDKRENRNAHFNTGQFGNFEDYAGVGSIQVNGGIDGLDSTVKMD
jgi:hypothetical protein